MHQKGLRPLFLSPPLPCIALSTFFSPRFYLTATQLLILVRPKPAYLQWSKSSPIVSPKRKPLLKTPNTICSHIAPIHTCKKSLSFTTKCHFGYESREHWISRSFTGISPLPPSFYRPCTHLIHRFSSLHKTPNRIIL